MLIPIPSNRERFVIKLSITAFAPLVLGIKAYDPYRFQTHYFRRKAFLKPSSSKKGKFSCELTIPMPISPPQINLELVDKNRFGNSPNGSRFQVDKMRIEKMPPTQVWASAEQHRFMEFAIQFAQKAGYAPIGFYDSLDHEFLIQYLPAITDQYGDELITPARIHKKMPRVQLSKRLFKQYSIPVRVAILAHEGCHYFNNTRSEQVADQCGIKYYLDSGFPTIEAVYAATKVFRMHPVNLGADHIDRTRDIINLIDRYKASKNSRKAV